MLTTGTAIAKELPPLSHFAVDGGQGDTKRRVDKRLSDYFERYFGLVGGEAIVRISAVTVRNYRSLRDVHLEVDDYGVFVGANGSGKSSVLYALDWFFNDTSLTETDFHGYKDGEPLPPGATVEVAVTFADLTDKDRERLEQYGRSERAEFRRTWYVGDKRTKMVGNAKQGPGFAEVRNDQGAADRRKRYRALRETYPELPDLGGSAAKDAILNALAAWESDRTNFERLVEVSDAEVNNMMGWNGVNRIRECLRFVLIPAAVSIAGEVGSVSRGSTLTQLVGSFISTASARAQEEWLSRHATEVDELNLDIRASIEQATGMQTARINARLASLVPNANVTLTPTVPDFVPRLEPSIATAVTIDGITNDVSRQGHGVQRAVMMSMLQALVPDEDLTRELHQPQEGEGESEANIRLEDSLGGLPNIIVAIEEPEIYQHPVRARSFARTLLELSAQAGVQVMLATHSPYFIQPEKFAALHRFSYVEGETRTASTDVPAIARTSGIDSDKVEKAITASVPTEFSEGFFADAVALVEGQTDRVILEAVASKLGQDFDRLGITIQSVEGKGGLRVARAILMALKVPTYVLADGDFGTAVRKSYKGESHEEVRAKRDQAHQNHKSATEGLVASLPSGSSTLQGSLPYSFGDPTLVSADFAIWKDDIEEELAAWPSFTESLSGLGVTLSLRNNKNLLAYRNAVFAAKVDDMPEVMKLTIGAIVDLARREILANTDSASTSWA